MFSARMHTPHERALGAALGVSMGLLPVFPLQILILGLLCIMIRCYRALAFVTVWILNPLTFVPIYVGEYYLGAWLLKTPMPEAGHFTGITTQELVAFTRQSPEVLLSLLAGGIIVSLAGGILTYILARLLISSITPLKRDRY
jgi:uncharacterized protein (DUF2062 family)